MDQSVIHAIINLFGEVLLTLDTMDKRMKKLEELDAALSFDVRDWLDRLEAYITGRERDNGALKAIQAYKATHCANDSDGKPLYMRSRYNSGVHTIAIVYDVEGAKEENISIRAIPDIDSMPLEDLREYAKDLEDKLATLDGCEPLDQTSDEYRKWEYEYSEADDALDEVGYRIEELESGHDSDS